MSKISEIKKLIIKNLRILEFTLQESIDNGLLDTEDHDHNEILDLIDQTHLSKNLDELSEVIYQAKTIETKVDGWFSSKGLSTFSLTWPL